MYRTQSDKDRETIGNMTFRLDRLQEKVDRLERELSRKADKGFHYENWDSIYKK